MNKSIIAVPVAALILVGGSQVSGFASHHRSASDTGTYLYSEWYETAEGQSQANVEGPNTCGCTGTVTRTWTGNGGLLRKEVTYPTNGNTAVILSYRKETDGTWRTYDYKELGVVDGPEFNAYQYHYAANGLVG